MTAKVIFLPCSSYFVLVVLSALVIGTIETATSYITPLLYAKSRTKRTPSDPLLSSDSRTTKTTTTQLNAIGALVKKAKLQELQKYIKENSPLPSNIMEKYQLIQQHSNDQQQHATPTVKIGPLQQALTKRKGTLSVIAEYKRPSTVGKAGATTATTTNVQERQMTVNNDGTLSTKIADTNSNLFDIEILSTIFREVGVTGISILADATIGGCTYETDLQYMVNEQNRVRISNAIPGPMYIVNSDIIVDPLQIAQTAAIQSVQSPTQSFAATSAAASSRDEKRRSEVAAIVLQYNIVVSANTNTAEDDDMTLFTELLNAARALDIEVIVTVTNSQQAQNAITAGASILCIMAPVVPDDITATETTTTTTTTMIRTNNTFVDAQIACIENVQYPPYNTNVCYLVHIPSRPDNPQWTEIEDVWYLRDTHLFQGIYVSDVLYKGQISKTTTVSSTTMGSNDNIEHPGSIIKSMISKSSKIWGVVTTKSGRGEGAREYLGDILM